MIVMTMVNCPLCGNPVRVLSVEIQRGYFCSKCHTPFHVNRAGTAVVGEPKAVDVDASLREMKQGVNERLAGIPIKKIVVGLSALLVALVVWAVFFGPAETMEHAAKKAAQALAENDRDYLVSIADPGTAGDLSRWFDEAHGGLLRARQSWQGAAGQDETVDVHVTREDQTNRKGEAMVSIHPVAGPRDVWLANPSAATATAIVPFDTYTLWTLNGWGRWRIDGHATYARAHGTQGPQSGDSARPAK
jgi:hypothetical protein